MATGKVMPVFKKQLFIGIGSKWKEIPNMSSLTTSYDANIVNYYVLGSEIERTEKTGVSETVEIAGKKLEGNEVHKFISSLRHKCGDECKADIAINNAADGYVIYPHAVIEISADGDGDSRDLCPLEFTVHADGEIKEEEAGKITEGSPVAGG